MISSKSIKDLIIELNEGDETEHLEAKSISHGDVGKSVYETICALSNDPDLGGGTILLGIQKEMALFPQYEVVGVGDNPDKVSSDIASGCSTKFNVPVRIDISRVMVGNKAVLRIDVPELNSSQKPVYFKQLGLPRGAFRRIGPSDQHCTDEDLTAFFQSKAQEAFDTHIVDGASWNDIDPEAVDAYRRARREANPHAEELNWSDDEILHALGGLVKDSSGSRITATGLLVFGKSAALRRISPAHRVDYIRVPGKEWVSRGEVQFDSIDMRGPIITVLSRVLNSVLDDLPRTFRVEGNSGQREDVPIIPARVIREAVVNSIMHRNYQTSQPVQIIRYSNRLEIRNPGYSLKSQERFGEPGSALRNPHIAEILHETRYAETKGSGLRVMRDLMGELGLTAPTFSSNRDGDEFSAIFLFHHFLSEADWRWLAQFSSFKLSEDQMRSLIFLREAGAIDNSAYRSLTQVDTLSASKSLRRLRELNLVEDRGGGSRTYYVPGTVMREANLSDDVSMHANSLTSERLSRVSKADLPASLRLKIERLGRRVEVDEMEAVIVALCAWRPLSVPEISALLNKTSNYISNKYVYQMVKRGLLRHKYPEMVKHPRQKYIADE